MPLSSSPPCECGRSCDRGGNNPATMKSVLQPCTRVFRHSVGMPVAVLLLLLLALVGCSGGGAADQQSASGSPPTPTPTCFQYSEPYCNSPEPSPASLE